MKICLQCALMNDYAAGACRHCGHRLFVPLGVLLPDSPFAGPGKALQAESMTIEQEGNLTLLKCRSPGEAYLIVQQLEAANILVSLPDAKVNTDEFHRHGFVSLRVSTRAHEAATEVQRRIDRRHWENYLSLRPPSPAMNMVAVCLGLINVLGLIRSCRCIGFIMRRVISGGRGRLPDGSVSE